MGVDVVVFCGESVHISERLFSALEKAIAEAKESKRYFSHYKKLSYLCGEVFQIGGYGECLFAQISPGVFNFIVLKDGNRLTDVKFSNGKEIDEYLRKRNISCTRIDKDIVGLSD